MNRHIVGLASGRVKGTKAANLSKLLKAAPKNPLSKPVPQSSVGLNFGGSGGGSKF